MTFDTSIFDQKEFREAVNKLEELLSHSKTVLGGRFMKNQSIDSSNIGRYCGNW